MINNFIKLSKSSFIPFNQNGFNNALYDYFGCDSNEYSYTKKEVRQMVQNFPTKYPCVCIIIDKTFDCGRVYIEVIKQHTFDELLHSGYDNIKLI